MNEHPAPPRPPPLRRVFLRTTTEILKQTTSIFATPNNLLVFLLLSLFVFSLRTNVETATHFLTSFIDNDPSIKSLIYRVHGAPNSTSPTSTIITRRRPFLHLTRVRILKDDFFSEDDEFDHRIHGNLNSTLFILDSFDPQLGFSNFVSDNGIRASETVRSSAKMSFRLIEIVEKEENIVIDGIGSNDSKPFNESVESKTDFQSFSKRFELERHEFTALLFLIGAFSASYVSLMLGFVLTHASIHGTIFVLVLNDFCKRHNSFAITLSTGSFFGLRRLPLFFTMRWLIRDALTQLLGAWFFVSIKDRYSLLKIFLKYKFMPLSPWVKGFEKEIDDFQVSWVFMDLFVSYAFAVVPWIVLASSRRRRRRWKEAVKEGCHLLSLSNIPAINLKCFEVIVCGRYGRWVLTQHFGVLFAVALQSFMEVYFMVAWMVYYVSVRTIDARSSGQPFGQRELEAMLEDVR